jgi:predicted phage baseplate assembly protein
MDANSTDTAWAQTTDDQGVVTISFGDNVNGAVPDSGLNIYAGYRVGGGVIGNLSANQVVDIASSVSGVSIASSTAMTGGADAEGIDQIRVNAPRAYRTQDRAVTLADYGNLALGVSSISQANAIANTYTNITVYCTAVGNTTPSQGLLDTVTSYLSDRAMAGATVTAQAGSFVSVNIGATATPVLVGCNPRYNAAAIQTKAVQAIQGLFDPSVVSFAQRLSVSQVYAAINAIPGVAYAVIPMMARSDATQSGTADVICRAWEIPVAGNIVVTATAS